MINNPNEYDLQECWEDIRRKSPILVVRDRPSQLKDSLELVTAKTGWDLAQECADLRGKVVTPEILVTVVARAVRLFMAKWYEHLRGQNLAGLIEIVVEGQDLTPSEMKAFLGALPTGLLERIARSAVGSGTGIHGLIGVEHARRTGSLTDYSIGRDPGCGNRVFVRFPRDGKDVEFFLDEQFELP